MTGEKVAVGETRAIAHNFVPSTHECAIIQEAKAGKIGTKKNEWGIVSFFVTSGFPAKNSGG